ncbi:MAG TPA: ABC-F family ATP-binding cassette domain-containing protein [Desertimonas sp.]|nr:ABC-F family ATP-binding cassette domain-containing protein [Desertimonas sp.]
MPSAAPLRGRGLTVSRGPLVVLDSINVTVASGETIGLVGPNGVGKSTLLGVLAGRIQPDRGSVERTPPAATVGYLPQEPRRDRVELVAAYLERRTGATAATAELDAATMALADREVGAENRYDRALQRWLSLGVADLPGRIGEVWSELGLADDLVDQPTASLSGGEAARVGLAALLLSRFDVYLLDEPTNDLDLDGLDRLERWIEGLKLPGSALSGVVLVSHDRTFLARTVDTVVELDEFTHRATTFGGGWQAYLDEKAAAERHAWERFDDYETKRTALAGRAQREREWATQGQSKARRSDERDKFIRHHQINQTEQLAGRAARTERAMERMAVVDKPRVPWQLRLDIATASRSGDIVARFSDVVVRGGPFTLGPLDLLITAGERIALVGANGSGKTTLLNTILGRVTPERGTVQCGRSVITGEVVQARDELLGGGPTDSLLRVFQGLTGLDAGEGRTLLAKFGLVADHVLRPPATLSPGERTRASLAVLMARQVNLLVLDEPTNHLDLPAIEQLEVALDAFRGTILLVTHDRALLENVRLTRTIELAHGQIARDRAVTS